MSKKQNKSNILYVRLEPVTIAKLVKHGHEVGLNKSTLARTFIIRGLQESQPIQPPQPVQAGGDHAISNA